MSKETSLEFLIATSFLVLIVISAWVAVLTLAFKAFLLVFASLPLYSLLVFAWRKFTGHDQINATDPPVAPPSHTKTCNKDIPMFNRAIERIRIDCGNLAARQATPVAET